MNEDKRVNDEQRHREPGPLKVEWRPRPAQDKDVPALEQLIPLSVRALQARHYSPAQMEAALGPVFGVDRQLIRDGTYFVVESDGQIVGGGGWSRRRSLFGGDGGRSGRPGQRPPSSERDADDRAGA